MYPNYDIINFDYTIMTIMSNITKNHKVGIFAMFIAAALVGSVVAFGDNYAYAGGKKKC